MDSFLVRPPHLSIGLRAAILEGEKKASNNPLWRPASWPQPATMGRAPNWIVAQQFLVACIHVNLFNEYLVLRIFYHKFA
jgi:hypothetical protein